MRILVYRITSLNNKIQDPPVWPKYKAAASPFEKQEKNSWGKTVLNKRTVILIGCYIVSKIRSLFHKISVPRIPILVGSLGTGVDAGEVCAATFPCIYTKNKTF